MCTSALTPTPCQEIDPTLLEKCEQCGHGTNSLTLKTFEDDELLNFCLDLSLKDNQARPPAKKQRFDTSKEAELDQLLDGTTARSTKYSTTYADTVFY